MNNRPHLKTGNTYRDYNECVSSYNKISTRGKIFPCSYTYAEDVKNLKAPIIKNIVSTNFYQKSKYQNIFKISVENFGAS